MLFERYPVAGAYLKLSWHLDRPMRRVADHLLISAFHAYRCCRKARRLVRDPYTLVLCACVVATYRDRRAQVLAA